MCTHVRCESSLITGQGRSVPNHALCLETDSVSARHERRTAAAVAGVRLLRLSGPFPPFRSVLRVSGDSLRRGPGRLVLESDLAPRRLPFGAPTPHPLPRPLCMAGVCHLTGHVFRLEVAGPSCETVTSPCDALTPLS